MLLLPPIALVTEYLAGHYILQSASFMCSVLVLEPQEKERILDMASAPGNTNTRCPMSVGADPPFSPSQLSCPLMLCLVVGGKTSFIAHLMKNTGCVVANDLKRGRLKATVCNQLDCEWAGS